MRVRDTALGALLELKYISDSKRQEFGTPPFIKAVTGIINADGRNIPISDVYNILCKYTFTVSPSYIQLEAFRQQLVIINSYNAPQNGAKKYLCKEDLDKWEKDKK